jgi:hypothetical protein
MKSQQEYQSEAKRREFMQGWFAMGQGYFQFMKDHPVQRKIVQASVVIECGHCGDRRRYSVSSGELNALYAARNERFKPCPKCQKEGIE